MGSGLHPKLFPSASGYWIHDLLARGLAELGHHVFYMLRHGAHAPLPPGVRLVSNPVCNADILHTMAYGDDNDFIGLWPARRPWVATCHKDAKTRDKKRHRTDNWIFVSKTLAGSYGRNRYVLNGVDPASYIYSETKDDYLFFMSSMSWGKKKGLDVALRLSRKLGFKLVVAGTGTDYDCIDRIAEMCRKANADYVGDVRGLRKAELLAGAKALIFPTKVNEAFGLCMVEALMSGTPVICSDKGACPEIISSEVGFVCRYEADYVAAINRIGSIEPSACREKAMREYHYLRMAKDYVTEYRREMSRNGN